MIKSTFLLLFALLVCVECQQKKLSKEEVKEFINMEKNKATALPISKNDLDWDQIEEQKHRQPEEPPLTISDEFIPEKEYLIGANAEEANSIFTRGMSFIERGKGHGREGRLAAFTLFENAAQLGHQEAKKLTAFSHMFGDFSRWSLSEAKNTFYELEKMGSPDAQLALGFMHASGIGFEKSNQAKALIYYMFSALGGNPLAQMAMGFRYHAGVGVPQNCESALSYYQKVAKTVAENVRFSTGQAIQRIRLTDEVDPTVSIAPGTTSLDSNLLEYYKMLADKGDVSAQLGLGQIYLSGGRGVQQNFELAFRYFLAAASSGNTESYAHLGKMYLDGTPFTLQDDEKAFEYLLKAADKSSASAQASLGIMYLKGRGVKRNYDKAFKLLTLAAEKKNVDGQLYLGEMHYKGIPTNAGLKRDFPKAVKLFQLASQNGHILAYYNLAQMHAAGTGVSRSCVHAVELFKSVAERGKWGERLMEAYSAYKEGRHDEAAMKYLFMSEMGYEVAQTNLAHILDRGEATALFPGDRTNNLERALVQWQRSANQEYPIARIKLGDYYYYGLGTESDLSLAFSNYKIAVDRHAVAQAMFNLGYMHEAGQGITKDLYLAKRFYDQSIEHSLDAYAPAKMALVKLAFVFYLEEFNKQPIVQLLEKYMGRDWDLMIMGVMLVILLISYLILRRRMNGL